MKTAFTVLLVLVLLGGVGFLIYYYTPDVAHESFDARFSEAIKN